MKQQPKTTNHNKKAQVATPPRDVEYVPPPDEQIDEFVRSLCETLGKDDPVYRDYEVRSGLSSYLKLLTKVGVKKMNAPNADGPKPNEAN